MKKNKHIIKMVQPGSIAFLQKQLYFLFYRSDAAGDAGNFVF